MAAHTLAKRFIENRFVDYFVYGNCPPRFCAMLSGKRLFCSLPCNSPAFFLVNNFYFIKKDVDIRLPCNPAKSKEIGPHVFYFYGKVVIFFLSFYFFKKRKVAIFSLPPFSIMNFSFSFSKQFPLFSAFPFPQDSLKSILLNFDFFFFFFLVDKILQ